MAFTPAVYDRHGMTLDVLAGRMTQRLSTILLKILHSDAKGWLVSASGDTFSASKKQLKALYADALRAGKRSSEEEKGVSVRTLYELLGLLHKNDYLQSCFPSLD